MTQDSALDTTISESSMTAGEVETLRFVLDRSRAQFAWKVGGLDAAALRRPHPPSAMTLGGLIKHVALNEDYTTAAKLRGQPLGAPWDGADFDADPDWEWHTAADDSPEELYRLWRDAVERSRAAVDAVLAEGDGGLDQPAKFQTGSGESPNIRRVLVDLFEHYMRHVGHADVLREAIDGLVGEDPPQP